MRRRKNKVSNPDFDMSREMSCLARQIRPVETPHSQSQATVHTLPLWSPNVPSLSPLLVNHTLTTLSLEAEKRRSPSALKTIWVRERSCPWRMMGF